MNARSSLETVSRALALSAILLAGCSTSTPTTARAADTPAAAVSAAPATTAAAVATPVPAAPETCYELSAGGRWSRTPEVLCIAEADKRYLLYMRTGLDAQEVGRFHFDLLDRVKCADCNKDVYGMADPTNTVFNALKVKFDGKRDIKTGDETGKVAIGSTSFTYRLAKNVPHGTK